MAENHRRMSLHVISLYTNVSVEYLIKILNEKTDEILIAYTHAIRIVLNETVF